MLTVPGLVTAPVSMSGAGVTPSSEALDAASPAVPLSAGAKQACYSAAMLIATKLTASLGLRGFRLNLAVEAAAGYDDLLALLPRIQDAVGVKPCLPLAKALKG